jgi:hypothetical protein
MRMIEATGTEAKIIHRLLEFKPKLLGSTRRHMMLETVAVICEVKAMDPAKISAL